MSTTSTSLLIEETVDPNRLIGACHLVNYQRDQASSPWIVASQFTHSINPPPALHNNRPSVRSKGSERYRRL